MILYATYVNVCQRRIQVSISGDVKRESYDIKWHQISYGDWMSLQVEWLRLQDVVMPEAMAVHARSRPRSMYNEYSISFYYDIERSRIYMKSQLTWEDR